MFHSSETHSLIIERRSRGGGGGGGGSENVPKVRDGDNTRRMQNMIADLFWCLLIESMFNNSLISM